MEETEAKKRTIQMSSTLPTVGKLEEGRAIQKSPRNKYTLSKSLFYSWSANLLSTLYNSRQLYEKKQENKLD
jgi:hypothetical protein